MAQIAQTCNKCGKRVEVRSRFSHSGKNYFTLNCGHVFSEVIVKEADYSDFVSADGRTLRPYQIDSAVFGEKANFRCLFAHEQGLGKTVIALALLKKHQEELTPTLIVCKSSLKYQWFHEVQRWTGLFSQIVEGNDRLLFGVFPVFIVSYDLLRNAKWIEELNGKIKLLILDECQAIKNAESKRTYFVRQIASGSYDKVPYKGTNLDRRKKIETIAKNLMTYHGLEGRFELVFDTLKNKYLGLTECRADKEGIIRGRILLDIEHVETHDENEVVETILHEIAHAITPGAGHVKIWKDTSLAIGGNGQEFAWCNGTTRELDSSKVPINIIALSGTPIKNKANEYFPILNILRPDVFYSRKAFERDWIGSYYESGKYKTGRLLYPEDFKKRTKDYILRYERKEVAKDLPEVDRIYSYSNLGDDVEKAYASTVKQFAAFSDENEGNIGGKNYGTTLAFLSKMRHLTGLAKVDPVVDKVEEFLENTEEKIVIFHHHIDVGDLVQSKLSSLCKELGFNAPLRLSSDLNSEARYNEVEKFRKDPLNRILIASTLASGEGLNLQFCSHCIMMERQWNPANEEQAEGRFPRIGRASDAPESISADYMLALGTVDELFTEIVENKRKIIHETLSGKSVDWTESDLMIELGQRVLEAGKKKWKI